MKKILSPVGVGRSRLAAAGTFSFALLVAMSACASSVASSTQTGQQPLCLVGSAETSAETSAERQKMVAVELAQDFASRARGLMQRTELAEDEGMLFYYPRAEHRSFWMYQTLIPLDIAYVADDGEILQIITMQPCTSEDPSECQSYPSSAAARAALELNAGAFAQFGIGEGDYVYDENCQQTLWHSW